MNSIQTRLRFLGPGFEVGSILPSRVVLQDQDPMGFSFFKFNVFLYGKAYIYFNLFIALPSDNMVIIILGCK
jgi:hypothetical protein